MTWISQYILPGFAVLVPALVGLFIIYWTRQALVASVRPQIECYLRPSSVRPDVCDFVLANEGLGSARNVSYRLDYDEQDFRDHTVIFRKRETDFPFQTVGSKSQITSKFGFFVALGRDTPLKPFDVTVTYEWKPFFELDTRRETRLFTLDARPFFGLIPPEDDAVASALKAGFKDVVKALKESSRRV